MVIVKTEPASPKAESAKGETAKRKLDAIMTSDVEFADDLSIDDMIVKPPKAGKAKQTKAAVNKTQIDGTITATRKSTRLNAPPPDKKARIARDTQDIPEDLFNRLGAEFASLSKTCNDISEYFRR